MSFNKIEFDLIEVWPKSTQAIAIQKWIDKELSPSKFRFIKDSISIYDEEILRHAIGYDCEKLNIDELGEWFGYTPEKTRRILINVINQMKIITKKKIFRFYIIQI